MTCSLCRVCHLTSWLALHSINFTSFNLTCALLDSRWLRRAQLCMKSKCGMNRRSGHFLLLHIHIAASSSILILFISVLHARKRASRRSESDFHITCARSSPARADCAFLRRPRALYCFDAILIPHWIFPQIYVCNVFEFGKKKTSTSERATCSRKLLTHLAKTCRPIHSRKISMRFSNTYKTLIHQRRSKIHGKLYLTTL